MTSLAKQIVTPEAKPWPRQPLDRWRSLGVNIAGCVGLVALVGYAADFEPFWRPFPGWPAIHPNSAMCIVLLAYGLSPRTGAHSLWRRSAQSAIVVVLGFLLLWLGSSIFGVTMTERLTPFGHILTTQAAAGRRIFLSPDTACALLAIALAEACRWFSRPTLSQMFAGISIGTFFVAATGYIDGVPIFDGTMPPLTLLGAVPLALVVMFAVPTEGFVRVLLAPSAPGRLARPLLGISTALILLIGWLVAQRIDGAGNGQGPDHNLLVYQTAGIIGLAWVLVTLGMMRADKIDGLRVIAEQSLIRAATIDTVTGLLSRNRMRDLRITAAPDGSAVKVAHLFIDLDRFRPLNQAFGHDAGDDVLREAGRRLLSIAGEYHVGRVGGDEFVIICAGITVEDAERLGDAVTESLSQPFDVVGHAYHLTASVGIAHTETAGSIDLRRAADAAMFVAKNRGGNQAVSFAATMHDAVTQKVELEQELHEALEKDGELTLVYQPVVRLTDGSLYATETLARWTHPRLGKIPPDRFIPIAEATGLIVPLGKKLMRLAVEQAAQWHARYPGRCPIVNVNISPIQFATGDVIGDFVRLLWECGLSSSTFCIEVTEGAFSDENAIQALQKARVHGFKVAMDDFGIGYSSLSQLPRLPLTSVKVDRSFIVNAMMTTGDAAMLSSIVRLAHDLGLLVVAEGVESPEQLALVKESGCDTVQGYIFSRPLAPADFDIWLSGHVSAQASIPVSPAM